MYRVMHSDVTSPPPQHEITQTQPQKHTHSFTTTTSSDKKPKNTNTHTHKLHLCTRAEGIWTGRIGEDPPPDRGGSSSSTLLLQTGGGNWSTAPAARSQPEVIEVDDNKPVLANTRALTCTTWTERCTYCPRTSSKLAMTSMCRKPTGERVRANGRLWGR